MFYCHVWWYLFVATGGVWFLTHTQRSGVVGATTFPTTSPRLKFSIRKEVQPSTELSLSHPWKRTRTVSTVGALQTAQFMVHEEWETEINQRVLFCWYLFLNVQICWYVQRISKVCVLQFGAISCDFNSCCSPRSGRSCRSLTQDRRRSCASGG